MWDAGGMRLPLPLRSPLLAVVVAAAVAACATTPSSSSASGHAADYVPLAVGNRWTYQVTPGPPEPQEVRIVEQDERGFYVDNHGGKLAPRSDGVFDGERFVLQDPIVVDHAWTARPKAEAPETYKIVATDAVVTVPAGTFPSCVEVHGEQTARDPDSGQIGKLLITWVYAKGVGLIRVQQQVQLGANPPVTGATMELASFTPAASSTPRPAAP